ncbi:hypothetical protein J6590_032876 [Homalodisca vitripennis]|nr:hypothetical protein J6590_032876 [Homalodisca vitripennis]
MKEQEWFYDTRQVSHWYPKHVATTPSMYEQFLTPDPLLRMIMHVATTQSMHEELLTSDPFLRKASVIVRCPTNVTLRWFPKHVATTQSMHEQFLTSDPLL